MAQRSEQRLPTSEYPSLNPVIDNCYTTANKVKMWSGMAHLKIFTLKWMILKLVKALVVENLYL